MSVEKARVLPLLPGRTLKPHASHNTKLRDYNV